MHTLVTMYVDFRREPTAHWQGHSVEEIHTGEPDYHGISILATICPTPGAQNRHIGFLEVRRISIGKGDPCPHGDGWKFVGVSPEHAYFARIERT